jgi:hypothetical protein
MKFVIIAGLAALAFAEDHADDHDDHEGHDHKMNWSDWTTELTNQTGKSYNEGVSLSGQTTVMGAHADHAAGFCAKFTMATSADAWKSTYLTLGYSIASSETTYESVVQQYRLSASGPTVPSSISGAKISMQQAVTSQPVDLAVKASTTSWRMNDRVSGSSVSAWTMDLENSSSTKNSITAAHMRPLVGVEGAASDFELKDGAELSVNLALQEYYVVSKKTVLVNHAGTTTWVVAGAANLMASAGVAAALAALAF